MVEPLNFFEIPRREKEHEFPLEGLIHDLGQHDGLNAGPYLNLSCLGCGLQILQAMRSTRVLKSPLQLRSETIKTFNGHCSTFTIRQR